ncbi:MAG TPA: hypothetical protein VMS64_32310 [Candidatus Methylomirabilis sp.]|nr:hypothetical protein [Candidatus Methylomirabilis sp.]
MRRTVAWRMGTLLACVGLAAPGHVTAQTITPGQVIFVNSCSVGVTLLKNGTPLAKLNPNGQQAFPVSSFTPGGANVVMSYPNLDSARCPDCDRWTDLGGPPGTVQREAWMWMDGDAKYAAYCNPNLSGRNICAAQKNCCGAGMVQDGTFGTHWEFTPKGGGSNDFVNLSTNAGSGPHSPPPLCGGGVDPDNCVTKAANIFYNVPIAWTTNLDCNFTKQGKKVKGLQCTAVNCPDAYTYPKDDKQAACPVDANRGYVVQYCPAGSSLPSP